MSINLTAIRRQFPILDQSIGDHPLVYLDNAATSQKPLAVLDALHHFSAHNNANINRGVHVLAERATIAYDTARATVQTFINARHPHEIIFTRNATEAINLVTRSWGANLRKDDIVVLSQMEHHSNIVPWLQLKAWIGIHIEWLPINDEGHVSPGELETIMKRANGRVKIIAITGMSNVLGTMPDIGNIVDIARSHGALTLIDAAQLAAHTSIDVQKIDCDFLVLSGHKLYGPTGIGIVYGKEEWLRGMPPFLGGGDMIQTVDTDGFTTAELPRKFEAGTPPISEAIGLAAAINWIHTTGADAIYQHEQELIEHALEMLPSIKGLRILGTTNPQKRHGCISFTVDGIHPHDLTQILSDQGICLRSGHHCTQPLHTKLGITASTRLSVATYNTVEEIDMCVEAIKKARSIFLKAQNL